VGINHIDYETCNDLYDGEIVSSVILRTGCLAVVKIVTKATPAVPISIGKARGRKDWIDATICELSSSYAD
jgi:hypothetical protein